MTRELASEEVVDVLARIMRDRAYPEFTAAPPPLWAQEAAAQIIDYHQPMLRDELLRRALDSYAERLMAKVEALPGWRDPRYSGQFESHGLVDREAVLAAIAEARTNG